MKQKRTYVTLLLILAILVLGIVYAAYTADVLTINGSATVAVAEGEVDVIFTDATPVKEGENTTYAEITDDPDVAEFAVYGLTTAGQTETLTFTVKNQTGKGVPVVLGTPSITNTNTNWYQVTCTGAGTTIADEGTTTITVTVELLKTVATTDDETAANNNAFTITLNAEAAAVTNN